MVGMGVLEVRGEDDVDLPRPEDLRDGMPLENSGRAYLRNLEIEEAVYRSSAEGCWVDTKRT